MKNLILLGLIAFTLSLGVSCKKEEVSKQVIKTELKKAVAEEKVKLDNKTQDGAPIVTDPSVYNDGVWPHSTGLCYCGLGPKCHPKTHLSHCRYGQPTPGAPGNVENCTCNLR